MLEGMIPYFKRALIVALFFGAFFAFTTSVFAQAFPPGSSADPFTPPFVNTGNNPGNPNAPGYFPGSGGGTGGVVSPGAGAGPGRAPAGPGVTATATTATPPVIVEDGKSCWSSPRGFFHCIATAFFGTFVAIAGYALDWSIELFITQFGQMYIDYGVGAVVEGTWGTVRDIFNLTFIFGLVYIGFQIILGVNESGAKRTIPLLIVAALLVNFSLFIVKFIVDFSNLAALQIYNLFKVADTLNASGGQAKAGTIVDLLGGKTPSISLAFINTIGVTSLLSHNPSAGAADGVPLFYTFGMIVVFLVLIYVFFAAAILITIRFAALTFYMIFSPIMFLGWVFPGMKQYSDKFWQGLFGQAFFAPALLFMLYISYQLSAGLAGPNRVDGSVFKNEANALGFAQFVPYLVLIVVFLMASLIVAKKMANQGASMVGKVNDWGIGKLNGALRGGGGMIAGGVGQFGYKNIDKMANSDNRLARGVGRLATFSGARDKAEKAYKGSVQGQWKETRKKRSGEMANRAADANLARNITAGLTATPGSQAQIDFERSIQEASQPQLIESLKSQQPGTDGYNRIVRAMSHNQVKGLLDAKNDVFDAGKQNYLRAAYVTETANRMTIGTGTGGSNRSLPDAIARGSADDLAALGLPNLIPHASNISAARMDDLRSKLTATELQNLTRERTNQLQAMVTNPVSRAQVFNGKSDKEIARMPREVLLATDGSGRPLAIEYLNRNVLDIMMQGNSNDSYVNPGDRQALRGLITSGRVLSPNVSDMANWLTSSPRGLGF